MQISNEMLVQTPGTLSCDTNEPRKQQTTNRSNKWLFNVVNLCKDFNRMKAFLTSENHSTLQEWANFLTVLNTPQYKEKPLLQGANSSARIVSHLEKHFSKNQASPAVFRRLGKHTQLVLQFS